MTWHNLMTTGHGPGPRDSHSAMLVGPKMIVFGGTNGSKKVNDLHILDLRSREWARPNCKGVPPSPRESHTATLVGEDKLVIFGGSGEGVSNYLNDLHVLDLKTMWWISPEVKGDVPVPRDSHSAVAIANKLFVYGGDCGDRYQGNVDMLDMDTMTWSRIYVIGGVGNKQYYNDVWILDTSVCSWTRLNICGQKPQGRFSHTAVLAESDIAIYGGCGEDERPLNQLLILQLGAEHPNGRYNISMCKIFGSHYNQQKRLFVHEVEKNTRNTCFADNVHVETKESREQEIESKSKQTIQFSPDNLHPKRRRMAHPKTIELESEPEEHSLSLSQHSSPSHSDQDLTPLKKASNSAPSAPIFSMFKQQSPVSRNWQSRNGQGTQVKPGNIIQRTPQDLYFLGEQPSRSKPEQNLIGAEIHGKVDGSFDSGYLMTANVNGRIFRGVLFTPGPEVVYGGAILGQNHSSLPSHIGQPNPQLNHINPSSTRHTKHPSSIHAPESCQSFRQAQARQASPGIGTHSTLGQDPKVRSELQGVVLTLGGPGN
ncbi:hypothetical protein LguiA_008231 [Lonicera macranthoides]